MATDSDADGNSYVVRLVLTAKSEAVLQSTEETFLALLKGYRGIRPVLAANPARLSGRGSAQRRDLLTLRIRRMLSHILQTEGSSMLEAISSFAQAIANTLLLSASR